ncbi:MAG: hypothetical protein J1E34_08955 [Oscillospiraceae bacterium]|nr:hypothetical protein [Oscillospiraceae bacterium]
MKRRIFSILLALTMLFSAFPIKAPLVAAEDNITPGTVGHIADADTTDSYPQLVALRNESRRAGRVWADKSVFTKEIILDMETDGYDGSVSVSQKNGRDFLHVFSTLGSSQVVDTKETIPLDVVFILDFSSSMITHGSAIEKSTRFHKTISAVNDAINTLIFNSPDSRVGIATYGKTAMQLMPLVKPIPEVGKTDTEWLEITHFTLGSSAKVEVHQKAKKATGASEWENIDINQTVEVDPATNLQAGLAAGMSMLAEEKVTTWKSPRSKIEYGRIPVVIVMTDGGCNTLCQSNDPNDTYDATAWYDTNYKKNRNEFANDDAGTYIPSVSFPTLMTGAYNTARIDANYAETEPHKKANAKGEGIAYIYGVAVDINSLSYSDIAKAKISATLNPREYFDSASKWVVRNTGDDDQQAYQRAYPKTYQLYSSKENAYECEHHSTYVDKKNDTTVPHTGWANMTSGNLHAGWLLNKAPASTSNSTIDIYVSQLPKDSSISKQDVMDNLFYTDGYEEALAEDVSDLFSGLIIEIAGEKREVFIPIEGSNDIIGTKDALTYLDPIGKYMEVKTVKSVLLFGKMYNVDTDGGLKYYDEKGNFITDKAEDLTDEGYAYTEQHYKIVEEATIENPCYGENSRVTFNLSEIEIFERDTGNFWDTDVGDEMNSDKGYDKALHVNIPVNALPMQVANILVNSDNVAINYSTNVGDEDEYKDPDLKTKNPDLYNEYVEKKTQSTPLRVFYEVGIADEITTERGNVDLTQVSPDYILNNQGDDDTVYFYSNWYKETVYDGYVTEGNAEFTYGDPVLTFSPSEQNRYYIFQKTLPLYKNTSGDTLGGVVSGSDEEGWFLNGKKLTLVKDANDVKDEGNADYDAKEDWFYILIEYYNKNGLVHYALPRMGHEFGKGISGKLLDHDYLCWYDPASDEVRDFVAEDGSHIPSPGAGYVVAAKSGGLRVGDMAAGIGIKGEANNLTHTSDTYYMPTVSESTLGQSADDVVINLYLGNNGRLAVHDTQLLVTKTVETIGEHNPISSNMAFRYFIRLLTKEGKPAPMGSAIKATREIITIPDEKTGEEKEETIWRARIETIDLMSNNQGLLFNSDGVTLAIVDKNGNRITDPDKYQEGYHVYIGGVGSGDNFTYTLFDSKKGQSFHSNLGSGQDLLVPIEDVYLVPVKDYNAAGSADGNGNWAFPEDPDNAGLKKLNEPLIVGHVGFNDKSQIGFAVQTDYMSATKYQTQTLEFDSDGYASFMLRDGEGLLFIGLESGTKYTVTEVLTDDQVDQDITLRKVNHIENGNHNEITDKVYDGSSASDASHNFNNKNHTYTVYGDTTSLLTEAVHYFNTPPKTNKELVEPEQEYVKVGDEVTYVIYWGNDQKKNDKYITADITIDDPLDEGVNYVSADFVELTENGEYKKIDPLPKGWGYIYNSDTRTVTWTIKDAPPNSYGFVRLKVKVNANAPLDKNGAADNKISNKAVTVINGYEISTNTVDTPVNEFYKTEVSVEGPDGNIAVGEGAGNLTKDAESNHYVGPLVDEHWNITYNILFTNYKTEKATVTITDPLDPDVDFVSASYREVTLSSEDEEQSGIGSGVRIIYDSETRTVRWIIADVEPYASGHVSLTTKVNSAAWGKDEGAGDSSDDAPKEFKKVENGKIEESGTYIMVYNKYAASNTIYKGSTSVELEGRNITDIMVGDDTIIIDPDTNTDIMWEAEFSNGQFYLKNVGNGNYLGLDGNTVKLDQNNSTLWANDVSAGIFINGNTHFGNFNGKTNFRGYSGGLYTAFIYSMTIYKLEESYSVSESDEYEIAGNVITEEGRYLMTYDVQEKELGMVAASYEESNGSLYGHSIKDFVNSDGSITTNKTEVAWDKHGIMWDVEAGPAGDVANGFYLKNVAKKQYLYIGSGSFKFVSDKSSASLFENADKSPGVLKSGNVYFGNYNSSNQNYRNFRGYASSFYQSVIRGMTFYKQAEPKQDVDPGDDPNAEPGKGDYKILNTASIRIDNDSRQITDTIENPLLGSLIVEKQLIGSNEADKANEEFEFIITLKMPNGAAFDPNKFIITGDAAIDWNTGSGGDTGVGSVKLKHGQSVRIDNLTCGVEYAVTEKADEEFPLQSVTVNGKSADTSPNGKIDAKETKIIFCNAPENYELVELPAGGGKGTMLYCILGSFLTIGAIPWLIIEINKSRRVNA